MIAVIGLGYVGLPLAVAFSKRKLVLGFDIDADRVRELHEGYDRTGEVDQHELKQLSALSFSSDEARLRDCSTYIITVPTPVDENDTPDLAALAAACEIVGRQLSKGNLVVFESTVYPGCTEEFCVPILSRIAGLRVNEDYLCGYSPERINPGDKSRKIQDIVKITSGYNREAAARVHELYAEVITAGVVPVESIKVAEAAKVIENIQRDVNIALVNELAIICQRLDVNTSAVLDAAASKWNFQRFEPGLVGGHCIGVDPYYMIHKAKMLSVPSPLMSAAREVNNKVPSFVASVFKSMFMERFTAEEQGEVLVLGATFKENCSDLRNSKVFDLLSCLQSDGFRVHCFEPLCSPESLRARTTAQLFDSLEEFAGGFFHGVVIAVAHEEFKALDPTFFRGLCCPGGVLVDIKGILPPRFADFTI